MASSKPFRKRSIRTAAFKVPPTAAPEEDVSAILKVTLAAILTLLALLTIIFQPLVRMHGLIMVIFLVCMQTFSIHMHIIYA